MIEQLIEFSGNHMFLVAALILTLSLLIVNLAQGGGKNSIDPVRATQLINHEDAVVVDVRPIADFNKGHIVNSVNIPANGFKSQTHQLDKHKEKPVIISCRSGNQSLLACRQLRKAGFENVYNLRGGIFAWQNANLPISTRRKK